MTLKASQRNRLPATAFAYPATRKYPMPTSAQARKAGISEQQRLGLIRSARSRVAQPGTAGKPDRIAQLAKARTTTAQMPAAHGRGRRGAASSGRRTSR
jgi:hypothetical protein